MTIDAILNSPDQRFPIYLIEFTQGPLFWRYTTHPDQDVDFSGRIFVRTPCALSQLTQSISESQGGSGTITLPADDPVVQIFDAFLPADPVMCSVLQYEANDPDMQTMLIVSGQAVNVVDGDDGTTAVSVQPLYQSFNRAVPWQNQQVTCPLVLFGTQCSVNADDYKVPSSLVSAMDSQSITSTDWATSDATYFTAGYVRCRRTREVRFVTAQLPNGQLVISYPFQAAVISDIFDAYAGCQRTGDICGTKFNNKINAMVFEKIPTTNLFKTGIK